MAFISYYGLNVLILTYLILTWDENEVENTIISEYNWEIDPGTNTTGG